MPLKNKSTIGLILLLALAWPAVAAPLTSGSYKVPAVVAAPGGHTSLEATYNFFGAILNTRLTDVKGQPVTGVATVAGYTLSLGAVYNIIGPGVIERPGVPYGSVPLYISRYDSNSDGVEDAIRLTWEAIYVNPQIYVLTGSGSGEYANINRPVRWARVVSGGSVAPAYAALYGYGSGYLIHRNQVGAGSTSEVYYKGLQSSVTESTPVPGSTATCFETAEAVGKLNVTIYGDRKYNMVGVPFVQSSTVEEDVLSPALRQNGIEIMKFDNLAQVYGGTYFDGASWAGSRVFLQQGEATWVYNPLTGTGKDIKVTIVGKVPSYLTEISRTIYGGSKYNMLALPLPQFGTQTEVGLAPESGSEIMAFDNYSQSPSGIFVSGSSWNRDLYINSGLGFWYFKTGGEYNWRTRIR